MKFSEFMKKARGDMSYYKLAKLTGISAQQLVNYEHERSRATIEKAEIICQALHVTYVLGEGGRDIE